jgi:hypothetical protein
MYSNEIRDKFILLRAQNVSLSKMAEELGVHRNTLLEWDREYCLDIIKLSHLEREALHERTLPKPEQQLTDEAEEYNRVTEELRRRGYKDASTAFLANHRLALLSRLDKRRTP